MIKPTDRFKRVEALLASTVIHLGVLVDKMMSKSEISNEKFLASLREDIAAAEQIADDLKADEHAKP